MCYHDPDFIQTVPERKITMQKKLWNKDFILLL